MNGKKRYLVVLLVLLLLGFSVISFAGGNEEEPAGMDIALNAETVEEAVKLVEENPTEEAIEEVLEVIEEVENIEERETLTKRVEDTRPAVNPAKLITSVEKMVDEADNKNAIDEAQKFFEDNDIQKITDDLSNGTVKTNLNSRISNLVKVFNDTKVPVIEGIAKDAYTNEDVKLTIEDDLEVEKTVTLDGEKVEYTEVFTKEGTYVVTVTDKALNTNSITFTIDKTPATRNYSTIRVDGSPYTKVEDGTYYYHLKNGETFEFAIAFDEILLHEPTVMIDEKQLAVKLNPRETFRDEKRIYLYEGKVTLNDEYTEGNLNIKVSNVFDLAGNESTEEKITNQTPTSNHRIAVYDGSAPKSRYVAIISKANDYKYIKNGETVRFLVAFNEEINIPSNKDERTFILNINGQQVKFIRSQGAGFEYIAEYKIPENESNLKEGELTFEIFGYKDLTGNEGTPLTIATHNKYNKVIYDRTPIVISGLEKETYVYGEEIVPSTKDTDVKSVVLTRNDEKIEYELGDKIENVGKYKLVVTDKAGNETVKEFEIVSKQIEFELSIDKEIEFDNFEKTANIKVLNAKENDYEIDVRYYIMREDGTFYGPLKVDYAKDLGEYKVKVVIKSKSENYIDSITKELRFKIVDTTAPVLTITRNEETNTTYVRGIDLTKLVYTISKDGKIVHTVDSETCDCDNYFEITSIAKTYGDGEYTIEVVDAGGNKTTATTIIDTSKPEVINYTQVKEKRKNKVVLTFSEEIKEIVGWTKVENENTYYKYYSESKEEIIDFEDLNGIKNTYKFLVDATSPVVVASYTEKTIDEDSVNEFVDFPTFEVTDNSEGKVNKELVSGEVNPNKVGTYKLTYRFTDEVGNYTDVVITIKVVDKKSPVIEGIEEGMYYNTKTTHAIPNVADNNLKSIYLVSKITDKGKVIIPWKNGVEIKQYGEYTLVAEDKYGNKTEVNFVVDNIAPKVLFLDKIEYIQGNIIPIKPIIIEQYIEEIIVKKDGKVIEYKQGDQLTSDADYEIRVTDKAGNIGSAKFTMDSKDPVVFNPIGVYKEFDLLVYDKNYDKDNLIVLKKTKTIDIDTKLELPKEIKLPNGMKLEDYIKLPENGKMPEKIEFPIYEKYNMKGTTLTEEGEYILVVYDKAYNVTLTKVIIDKTKPTSNIIDGKSYKEVTPKVEDSNLVRVEILENKLIPLENYNYGNTITKEGNYRLIAIDKAGNTLTVDFKIDRTAPVIDASNIAKQVGAAYDTKLNVVAIAKDNIDGEISVIPKVKHSVYGDLGTQSEIDTSKKYVGTYTLIYNAKDEAGNEAKEVIVEVNVVKTDYVISMEDKTFAYNGKNREPIAEIRDNDGIVDGKIKYTIKNSLGKKVNEMKEIGIYYVTASTNSYKNVKEVTVKYTIEQAKLKVEMTDLVKNDEIVYKLEQLKEEKNTIKERLVFKNQNDEVVEGVESVVTLYKYKKGLSKKYYTTLHNNKVETGTYLYTVTALNKNYEIDNTAYVETAFGKTPIVNSVISKEYDIK